jgi:hypothetical protein
VKYSETERKLVETNDCALNHYLTQERTIREFQTAMQNLEHKVADHENYISDLKVRLAAAVTVSGAPSHPDDSEDRIFLTQKEEEVLRMVCNAPDIGRLCDVIGSSANDIFGMMKKRFCTPALPFGKRDENTFRPVTLWIRNLSLQQCVVTCLYSQWPASTLFFRARGLKIFSHFLPLHLKISANLKTETGN